MISVRNLEKRYGSLVAIQDVSFDVQRGDILGLLGHNGAGKTTVMKIMTGFIGATSGTVTVGGADVEQDRLAVQRQIGYLPENAPLYPEMLVQDYLIMMSELRAIPPDRRLGAVSRAVRATGLEPRLVQPIGTLSKGYRQRVGLAQAILHEPDVLVLDEPTSGLDPVQIVEIRSLIKKIAQSSTVILSTHILSEIEAVCNRVVILIGGNVAKDATLTELRSSNVVRISVSSTASGVGSKLKKVEGVESVRRRGPDPDNEGFDVWTLECSKGRRPAPEIIQAAVGAGWSIAGAFAEMPSLETVFGDLMESHGSNGSGKEAA